MTYTRIDIAVGPDARAVVTFTKRYGDGEPHTARVEIFTRESIQMDWAITETLNDCYLSVIH